MIMPVNRINYAYLQNPKVSKKSKPAIAKQEVSFQGLGIRAFFSWIRTLIQLGNIRRGIRARGHNYTGHGAGDEL